jgi:radical SAM protein with 4Fe4S-binding SPASM domain
MDVFDLSGFSGVKYVKGFKESGLLSLHRFFNCEAQISFLAFDLYGDLYPCWDAAGIHDLAIGSISPDVTIDTDKLNAWRGRTALDIEACQGCPIAPHCGGGCQFIALEHTGSPDVAVCDSMLAGYVHAITDNAAWLVERAREGDHVVGLVEGDRVRTAVHRPFGLLTSAADGTDLPAGVN